MIFGGKRGKKCYFLFLLIIFCYREWWSLLADKFHEFFLDPPSPLYRITFLCKLLYRNSNFESLSLKPEYIIPKVGFQTNSGGTWQKSYVRPHFPTLPSLQGRLERGCSGAASASVVPPPDRPLLHLPAPDQLQSQPPWNTLWLKQLKDNSRHNGKYHHSNTVTL